MNAPMSIAAGEYAFLRIDGEATTITALPLHPTQRTVVVRVNGRFPAHNPMADLILSPTDARALGQALLAMTAR